MPVITGLEKGRYYIQIAALSKQDSARALVARVSAGYAVVIESAVLNGNPLYRVLVGPLSHGESQTLLERLKATYKDAFVRVGK